MPVRERAACSFPPRGRQEMDVMVGDAMWRRTRIGMSASRMDAGLSKVVNHAKDTERSWKKRSREWRECARRRRICGGGDPAAGTLREEQACRLFLEKKILEMIDHSKHYTSLSRRSRAGPSGERASRGAEGGAREGQIASARAAFEGEQYHADRYGEGAGAAEARGGTGSSFFPWRRAWMRC